MSELNLTLFKQEIARDVEIHFLANPEATPQECIAAVLLLRCANLPDTLSLEEDIARLQLKLANDTMAAKTQGRSEAFSQLAVAFESFCDTCPPESSDYADVSGMRRAALIANREVA